jgi:RNA ligase
MFPKIQHLSDLLPYIESNKQIRVKPCEVTGHTVVCYMVQDEDTFAGEHELFERECRGITFASDGRILSRTLHKFFNVGERDETLPENIDWSQVVRVMEKRDGSMVTPVLNGEGFKFKTKKSFETKEAALADQIAAANLAGSAWISDMLKAGFTPTFEVTSPKYPIVVRYEKDELTLLHVRENNTGRYLTSHEINFIGCPFPVAVNIIYEFRDENGVSWDLFKRAAETREGIEGWVVQLASGEMFKIKTKWYCDLHHSVTFTRWRDVARTVCADQSDDLKAAFRMVGRDVEPILIVERKIKAQIDALRNHVESLVAYAKVHCPTAKDAALRYSPGGQMPSEHFGLIMRMYRGQEINWMEYYEKHHLENDWGLEVVE